MYDQQGDCKVCENNLILSPFNWTDVHSALIKNTENVQMNQDGLQPPGTLNSGWMEGMFH